MIQEDNRVYKVDVFVDAGQRLMLEIKQRRPILRVSGNNGEDYYLDQEGNYITKSRFRAVRVPIATGEIGKFREDWISKPEFEINKAHRIASKIYEDEFLEVT